MSWSSFGEKGKQENQNGLQLNIAMKKLTREEVMVMINVALQCVSVSPTVRPAMSSVVSMLEGRDVIQEYKMEPEEIKQQQSHASHRQVQSMSIHESWTVSSTSTADLYPVNFEASYWKNRNQKNGE